MFPSASKRTTSSLVLHRNRRASHNKICVLLFLPQDAAILKPIKYLKLMLNENPQGCSVVTGLSSNFWEGARLPNSSHPFFPNSYALDLFRSPSSSFQPVRSWVWPPIFLNTTTSEPSSAKETTLSMTTSGGVFPSSAVGSSSKSST